MKKLLEALKGSQLIAKGTEGDKEICHYLLPDRSGVLEVELPKAKPKQPPTAGVAWA
ncbi:MAG: hypothetical protein V1846_03145 [Candidatus Komeilibacteria bacterium]